MHCLLWLTHPVRSPLHLSISGRLDSLTLSFRWRVLVQFPWFRVGGKGHLSTGSGEVREVKIYNVPEDDQCMIGCMFPPMSTAAVYTHGKDYRDVYI